MVFIFRMGQCPKNRFYRTLPFAFHIPSLFTVYPFYVPLVLRPIVGDRKPFLVYLAKTGRTQRTALAYLALCTVGLLLGLGATVQEYLLKWDYLTLGAQVTVFRFVIDRTIGTAFVGAMGRDEALQSPFLQKGIVLTGTVPRVCNTVSPYQTFFP